MTIDNSDLEKMERRIHSSDSNVDRADLNRVIMALREAWEERDLAIAHDRQPYPTVWSYEQVCKALRHHMAESQLLRRTLEHCAKHAGCSSPCRDCPAEERGPVGGCMVQDDNWDMAPLLVFETERVRNMEKLTELAPEILNELDAAAECLAKRGVIPNVNIGSKKRNEFRAIIAEINERCDDCQCPSPECVWGYPPYPPCPYESKQ